MYAVRVKAKLLKTWHQMHVTRLITRGQGGERRQDLGDAITEPQGSRPVHRRADENLKSGTRPGKLEHFGQERLQHGIDPKREGRGRRRVGDHVGDASNDAGVGLVTH